MMKAWVLHDIGDIRLETIEEPVLVANEVLVEVRAAGICGSDIPRIFQTGAYSFPIIPGHEFSGVVVKTGADVDVFFECVGRNETLVQAIHHTAPAGKVMLVGNPYTDITLEKSVYWKILRNQLTVTGTWNSSFTCETGDDWNYVLKRLS